MLDSTTEVRAGDRFAFGANWMSFVEVVDDVRIDTATASLTTALGLTGPPEGKRLDGRTFLDAGCGSGLFSLAATRLGARVHAFDFDPASVAAATELRRRFAPHSDWRIETGSVLDPDYLAGLGQFDVVYSWGVLHHTGRLWTALAGVTDLVAPGGRLYISVYNDQGFASRAWRRVKRRYNRSGPALRAALVGLSAVYLARHRPLQTLIGAVRLGTGHRRPAPARPAPRTRGMSRRHDLVDWVGGYPFEVAKPEEVFRFLTGRGFELRHLTTCGGGLGCNEYVFERVGTGRRVTAPAQ
ncbi:class I SAM-dependent methyltransferase [Dactylosporangium sp. CA-152071]|uniref:class I SAM-dependent methyltransferase n=1 Tax=Dactylosporangium sp. CA-152071 TaxID=3239933 RepID=UPI003D8C9ACE